MTVFHRECGGEVKPDIDRAIKEGKTPGDWGYCEKCGKRVDHLAMNNKGEATISKEVKIQW